MSTFERFEYYNYQVSMVLLTEYHLVIDTDWVSLSALLVLLYEYQENKPKYLVPVETKCTYFE